MNDSDKTHYRKAFNSPYLSSADIVAPTNFTISHVTYSKDETKKTRDKFNTAHFVEKEIRKGEPLKSMILNATNCKTLKALTNTPFLEDWVNVPVTIYVDTNCRNPRGGKNIDGLRISPVPPVLEKQWLTKSAAQGWNNAIQSVRASGNLTIVLEHVNLTQENAELILKEASNV